MRQLLARRDARIYLIGQAFSLFGDSCLWLAMGVWVRTLTGSNAQAGLVFFFYTAPRCSPRPSACSPTGSGGGPCC